MSPKAVTKDRYPYTYGTAISPPSGAEQTLWNQSEYAPRWEQDDVRQRMADWDATGYSLSPIDSGPDVLVGVLVMDSSSFFHEGDDWSAFRINLCAGPAHLRAALARVLETTCEGVTGYAPWAMSGVERTRPVVTRRRPSPHRRE